MKATPQTHAFREALIFEMRRTGMSTYELARQSRCSHAAVRAWINGKSLPNYQRVALLSEIFGSEKIKRIGISALERTCEFCGKKFVTTSSKRGPAKTCGSECAKMIRKTGMRPKKEIPVFNAIANYCVTDCEFGESGACRNSSCFLAPFTPLPFAEPSMQVPVGKRQMSEEDKLKRSNWAKAYFANPENRAKVAAATKEALNNRSKEQSEQHGKAISRFAEAMRASRD